MDNLYITIQSIVKCLISLGRIKKSDILLILNNDWRGHIRQVDTYDRNDVL